MENGSLLVSLAGLAFVLLGSFQFIMNLIQSTDKKHKELFEEVERLRIANLELRSNLLDANKARKENILRLEKCKQAYLKLKKEYVILSKK